MKTGTRLRFLDGSMVGLGAFMLSAALAAPWWLSASFLAASFVALFIGCGFRFRYRREGR